MGLGLSFGGGSWWDRCGGTVGLRLRVEVWGIGEVGKGVSVSGSTGCVVLLGLRG